MKNVTISDLALIEILKDGRTDAPESVIALHRSAGYVKSMGGRIILTAKGIARAAGLRDHENSLRQMAMNARTGCAIRGVAGCSFTGAPRSRRMS